MSEAALIVVIPTRNRPNLAEAALASVSSQLGPELRILVSDNSTETESVARLSSACRELGDARVRYVVPPQPFPMNKHWDWAMEQALSLYDCSHVSFLTDRMMFKPEALAPLLDIITACPDKILVYMHDMVDDFSAPVVVRQYTWTGNLYEVPSGRLLEMVAQSVIYDTALPRMLNCIVPRTVLNAIRKRFGTIFSGSLAPDWAFCYRALEIIDSILFHDKAALIHYGQNRSTGQSVHHGIANDALSDFMRDHTARPLNFAAPWPEIITTWNAIISEYCYAKEMAQSRKFPEVDLDNYRRALGYGVEHIKDSRRREQMRELLIARGWNPGELPFPPPPPPPGVEAFGPGALEFQNIEAAMEHALKRPRGKAAQSDHEILIQGLRRSLPQELFGRFAPLIPPLELMHDGPVGYQEFKDNGEEFFAYYTDLCHLNCHERMLDVGSGIGRKTFRLADYIQSPGSYEGLDIVKTGIDWCTEHITRRNRRFRFQLIDVYNRYYNPAGSQKAADYRFPFEDGSFDFVVLASVFTHMLPQDLENYLSEVARVLRRGGRCLISFFLLNDVSRELLNAGKSSVQMNPWMDSLWTADPNNPETAIGYEEDFVRSLYDKHKLEIAPPIHYGGWSGREDFLSYQDLLLAFKPAN